MSVDRDPELHLGQPRQFLNGQEISDGGMFAPGNAEDLTIEVNVRDPREMSCLLPGHFFLIGNGHIGGTYFEAETKIYGGFGRALLIRCLAEPS